MTSVANIQSVKGNQTIQGTRHKYHEKRRFCISIAYLNEAVAAEDDKLETTYGKFVLAQEQKKPKYKA